MSPAHPGNLSDDQELITSRIVLTHTVVLPGRLSESETHNMTKTVIQRPTKILPPPPPHVPKQETWKRSITPKKYSPHVPKQEMWKRNITPKKQVLRLKGKGAKLNYGL